jgi:N-methylhydantoinase A/oxoprolinase/acetone carboxylase beta subunit
VPLRVPAGSLRTLAARFHREHARRFGFADAPRPVEVVTVEVRGAAGDAWVDVTAAMRRDHDRPGPTRARAARTRVRHAGRWRAASVWTRAALARNFAARGPAIVLEEGATLWIAPGWAARLHTSGTLVLERARRG